MTQTTQKTRRVLSRRFVILFTTTLLIVISIFKIPNFTLNRNLQDLGYSDEAISAIKVVKGAILVIDAQSGIQVQTVKHWNMLRKKNIELNGKKANGNEKLIEGDIIKINIPHESTEKIRRIYQLFEKGS